MSCSVLSQPPTHFSAHSSSTWDTESGYFPSGFTQEYERFKRLFGSSILFLGVCILLTLVVLMLYVADCVFSGLDGDSVGNCNGGSMFALIIASFLVVIGVLVSLGLCIRYKREATVFWNDLQSSTVMRGQQQISAISNMVGKYQSQQQYYYQNSGENNRSGGGDMAVQQDSHLQTSLTLPISPIKLRMSQVYDEKPIRSFEFPPELALPPRTRRNQSDNQDEEGNDDMESSSLIH